MYRLLRKRKSRHESRVSWLKNTLASGGRGSVVGRETLWSVVDITSFVKRKPER
jgi:hypothetical protein